MRDTDLVNAMRCVSSAEGPTEDCKKCPIYKTVTLPSPDKEGICCHE